MATTYTPIYSSATRDAFAGQPGDDPKGYTSAVNKRIDHKYFLYPIQNEILALIRGSLAGGSYRFTWTCTAGESVGDPVYVSAASTVSAADATTSAKAAVIGFVRHKPTTTTCYLDHFLYVSGLSGLTAGNPVYLTDAGGFGAATGTVEKIVGTAISTTEAWVSSIPKASVSSHASTHITAGSDEIDGDKLDIDWTPSNYTPATTPAEVDNVDHLTAHLYGIDQEVGTLTTHATGDGSDHADVATNTTHSTGDGSDHADVATNTTHATGDGSDHADVATNTSAIAAAVSVTDGGAGNSGKLFEADGSGYLDGRDVGADGAKLDNIEVYARGQNLCLNSSFENVLPGTHTSAIKQVTGVTDQNIQFPGWLVSGYSVSDDVTVDVETTNVSSTRSEQSAKLTVANATGNPWFYQQWTPTDATAQYLRQAYGMRLVFSADVKMSSATASAIKLFAGTDSGYDTSSYKAADTNLERLMAYYDVEDDSTAVFFGAEIYSATPDYYIDNCRVDIFPTSEQSVTSLPYIWRPPINIYSSSDSIFDGSADIIWTTPSTTSTTTATGSDFDTNTNVNTNRPPWANKMRANLWILNGSAVGDYARIHPAGLAGSSPWDIVGKYIGSSVATNCSGKTEIGADGQLGATISNTSVDMYVFFTEWIGEGL